VKTIRSKFWRVTAREDVTMGSGRQSSPDGRKSWPVAIGCTVGAGVGTVSGIQLAKLVGSLADIHSFWFRATIVMVMAALGAALGQFAAKVLFPPPPE
jgi:hypothetical protein